MLKLTEKEIAVLNAFPGYDNPQDTKEDTGSSWTDAAEIARATGFGVRTVAGVLGSLGKKDLVQFEDEVNGKQQDICCLTEGGCDALTELRAGGVVAIVAATEEEPATGERVADLVAAGMSNCKAMRTIATNWTGDRKSFIAAMIEQGMNKATASNSWMNKGK